MKKNDPIPAKDTDEVEIITGEVIGQDEIKNSVNAKSLYFGSFVTKSNDLIQKTEDSFYATVKNRPKKGQGSV